MPVKWKISDLAWTMLSMIGLTTLVQFILGANDIRFDGEEANSLVTFVAISLQWLAMLLPLWFFTKKKYGSTWADLGFNKDCSWWKGIGYMIGAYLLMLVIFGILSYLVELGVEIPGFEQQEAHLPLFGESLIDLSVAVLVMVILAPILEEIFFRGFVLQTLVSRWGRWTGTFTAAVIFAGIHFEFASFLGLFILALIINELFLRTRSIWVSIGFHIFNNSLAFLMEYLVLTEVVSI